MPAYSNIEPDPFPLPSDSSGTAVGNDVAEGATVTTGEVGVSVARTEVSVATGSGVLVGGSGEGEAGCAGTTAAEVAVLVGVAVGSGVQIGFGVGFQGAPGVGALPFIAGGSTNGTAPV